MSKILNRDAGLAQCRMQLEISLKWADWHMQAASNGYTIRKGGKIGAEPSPEEKESGMVIKWRPMTDPEKIDDYMNTAAQHLRNAWNFADTIVAYMNDDPDSLKRAQEKFYT